MSLTIGLWCVGRKTNPMHMVERRVRIYMSHDSSTADDFDHTAIAYKPANIDRQDGSHSSNRAINHRYEHDASKPQEAPKSSARLLRRGRRSVRCFLPAISLCGMITDNLHQHPRQRPRKAPEHRIRPRQPNLRRLRPFGPPGHRKRRGLGGQ